MTYTATLEPGGKRFSGYGNAEMHEFGGTSSMNVTLHKM